MDSHGCSLTAVVTHGSTWKHPEMAPILRVCGVTEKGVCDMALDRPHHVVLRVIPDEQCQGVSSIPKNYSLLYGRYALAPADIYQSVT